ncbi:MAG: N-acetyl-1-D-myo-inositol-2-amino-2-deoxy-alpha-D-glucopyranoside deacetylase [Angustibacter sp.]
MSAGDMAVGDMAAGEVSGESRSRRVRPTGRRLLLVHAHPDDETLATGLTMARAVADGTAVTVVTCTLGEEGEVLVPRLRRLASDVDDALGPHRAGELAAAMRAIGVRDHRVLADGRWRDSGMRWLRPGLAGPAVSARANAFALAEVDDAAAALRAILDEVRPQVVVTYDPHGGYGHPDHVMAHRATMRAVQRVRGWPHPAVHWVQVARTWADAERRAAAQAIRGGVLPARFVAPADDADHPAVVVDDERLDVVVRAGSSERAVVLEALIAHRTQVQVVGSTGWYALSNGVPRRVPDAEGFRRVTGPSIGSTTRQARPAPDLFAGLVTD